MASKSDNKRYFRFYGRDSNNDDAMNVDELNMLNDHDEDDDDEIHEALFNDESQLSVDLEHSTEAVDSDTEMTVNKTGADLIDDKMTTGPTSKKSKPRQSKKTGLTGPGKTGSMFHVGSAAQSLSSLPDADSNSSALAGNQQLSFTPACRRTTCSKPRRWERKKVQIKTLDGEFSAFAWVCTEREY